MRDGKGESIWDRYSHTPGKVIDGSTGDVACDHYHRWPEDIAPMKSLGLEAYRFSCPGRVFCPKVEAASIRPAWTSTAGLVDGLLAAGITPFITLYHWGLPQAFARRGGWPERRTAEAFVSMPMPPRAISETG